MDNFDIDSLKKTWQEQKVSTQYNEQQIEAMLGKSSRNYVKYILWISIVEFILVVGINILYVFQSQETNSFVKILSKLGLSITPQLEADFEHIYFAVKVFSIIMTGIFVYLFYKNYRKINVEANLKKFIIQIIRFKRTVNIFILANIITLVVFIAILAAFAFSEIKVQNISISNPTLAGFIVGLCLSLALMIALMLLYYRLVYGIIMRKLGKNLNQLQKTEQEY